MPTGSKGIKTSVKLDVKDAEKKLKLLEKRINKIQQLVGSSGTTAGQFSRYIQKAAKDVQKLDAHNQRAASSANKMASGYKNAAKQTNVLTKNLRTLASTYIGIMGLKAVATASDTITSAENKLNGLPGGSQAATQASMDKMYAAAQRSRSDYAGMMGNVSKTMTLAPDAFQNNIDNAIRFQEIMAKAYTVGGASAAEQHSSMYQMVQALGSGILQGDELRSIREGAPIAYQKIEEFAQGVYGAEENLKDLASQGKITSDIVVAAIMSAGDEIEQKFENTNMTFAQAMTNIKNTALQAFTPVLQMLNAALNSDAGQAILNGIGYALQIVAGTLQLVFGWISNVYNFIVTNWPIISKVLLSIAAIIAIALIPKMVAWVSYLVFAAYYYTVVAAMAVASAIRVAAAWIMANLPLFILLALLALLVVAIIWVSDSFVDACGNIVGVLAAAVSIIWNLFVTLVTLIIQQALLPLFTAWDTFANFFGNLFNDPIAAIIYSFEGLAQSVLGILKTIANGIDAIFGSNLADAVSGWQSKLGSKADALASKYGNGTYEEKSNAAGQLNDLLSSVQNKVSWNTSDAFASGYSVGASGGQWLSDKVSGIGDMLTGSGLPNMSDPAYAVSGGYDPSDALEGIKDDTGDISDAVKLTEEDMEYLRRVADMEWKKEFTTASITIDMNNTNTINNKGDLDGWAISLRDMLAEELDAVANGVYV